MGLNLNAHAALINENDIECYMFPLVFSADHLLTDHQNRILIRTELLSF